MYSEITDPATPPESATESERCLNCWIASEELPFASFAPTFLAVSARHAR